LLEFDIAADSVRRGVSYSGTDGAEERLLLDLVDEVDGTGRVGTAVVDRDVIEEPEVVDVALRAHHLRAAESVAGQRADFATDDIVVGLFVTFDADQTDGRGEPSLIS